MNETKAWKKLQKRVARIINRKSDWIFVTDSEDGRHFLGRLQQTLACVLGTASVFSAEIDYANQRTSRAMKVWWLSTPKERTPRQVLKSLALLFGGSFNFERNEQDVFFIGEPENAPEVLGMVEAIAKGKVWSGREQLSGN